MSSDAAPASDPFILAFFRGLRRESASAPCSPLRCFRFPRDCFHSDRILEASKTRAIDFGTVSSRRFREAWEGAWSVTLRVWILLEETSAQMAVIPLGPLLLAGGTFCSFVWHWERKEILIT